MPPLEPRQIKRPRLSLSCIVCRRRKVRCGREQPECANCVRLKEHCVYKTMVRDEFTGQVHQVSTDSNGPEFEHQQGNLAWSHWVSSETDDTNVTESSDDPPWPRPAQTNGDDSLSHQNTLSAKHSPSYLAVPSWEEVIQPLVDHEHEVLSGVERDGSSFASGEPPLLASRLTSTSTPHSTKNHHDNSMCSDYLSLRRGARMRYIGRAFWGFVAGKESLSDDFFDENRDTHDDLPLSHISFTGMFNLLRSLPTKPVSDALLEAFFLGVWPLSPLVHRPTLRADYDEFWDWCRNSETALPSVKLRDDPTFICLLFAVLLCGASAAPATSWMCTSLQGLRKETTVNHLESAYRTSLSLCQHLEHPTLNTLVSTLLTGPFLDRSNEPMHSLVSVSTIVRIAQSMGLHREEREWQSALGPVDREIRRRAWWCIVWLDVQSSISTGLPPCCGSEALNAVSMMADIGDVSDCLSPTPDSVPSGQSIAIMFAIGRSETARLQSKIVTCLQSGRRLTELGFEGLATAVKDLQHKIDALIARIPSQGIPERGFIPSRLAKASPSTHPSLYKDDATQPTVLAAWARIMLTLLKSEIAILLQKPFLPQPDSSNPHSCKAWTSMAHLCVSYLRIILQLYQTPAFSPYIWSCYSYYGPLQCVFLTLMYLHCFKDSGQILLARYCVDEMIDHNVSHYQAPAQTLGHRSQAMARTSRPDCPDSDPESESRGSSKKTRMPLAIQVLVDMHSRLDSPGGPAAISAGANNRLPSPVPEAGDMQSASQLPGPRHASTNRNEGESAGLRAANGNSKQTFSSLPSLSSSASSSSPSSSTTYSHRNPQPNRGALAASAAPAPAPAPRPIVFGTPFATESDSSLDLEYLASVSELESWSSALVHESSDILAHPDMNINVTDSDCSGFNMIGLDLGLGLGCSRSHDKGT